MTWRHILYFHQTPFSQFCSGLHPILLLQMYFWKSIHRDCLCFVLFSKHSKGKAFISFHVSCTFLENSSWDIWNWSLLLPLVQNFHYYPVLFFYISGLDRRPSETISLLSEGRDNAAYPLSSPRLNLWDDIEHVILLWERWVWIWL